MCIKTDIFVQNSVGDTAHGIAPKQEKLLSRYGISVVLNTQSCILCCLCEVSRIDGGLAQNARSVFIILVF